MTACVDVPAVVVPPLLVVVVAGVGIVVVVLALMEVTLWAPACTQCAQLRTIDVRLLTRLHDKPGTLLVTEECVPQARAFCTFLRRACRLWLHPNYLRGLRLPFRTGWPPRVR